jgi:hypothetical protein
VLLAGLRRSRRAGRALLWALAGLTRPPLLGPLLLRRGLLGLRDANALAGGLRTRHMRHCDDRQDCSGNNQVMAFHWSLAPIVELRRARMTHDAASFLIPHDPVIAAP